MTKDDIIRMAVRCQLLNASNREGLYAQALERFAALVATHEQERCALVCITLGEYYAECDDFEAEDVALACASSIMESEK